MRPQMMRPSELLRMIYQDCRDETWEIYPAYLEPEEVNGRAMMCGIVTANVNAIIAVACYQERLTYYVLHEDGWWVDEYQRPYASFFRNGAYVPHEALPIEWCIAGGV